MTSPNWLDRKACSPEHARLFFPGGSMYEPGRVGKIGNDYGPALALCRSCDAVAECKADAIDHGDIVDGYTTQHQVVGGCAPRPKATWAKEPVLLPTQPSRLRAAVPQADQGGEHVLLAGVRRRGAANQPGTQRQAPAGRTGGGVTPYDISDADAFDEEFYDADLDGAFCDLCGRELECGQWGECDRCTGLDRCPDDLCHGAGRCMHRRVRSDS